MSHPDPLLMSADIARVAAERPELDEDLLGAIYQHLVLIEGRQPTVDELREYVDRVSCLDQDTLRQRLGLAPRRVRGRRSRTGAPSAQRATPATPLASPRRAARHRGRPGWTPELFATRYQAARGRATPPYTDQSIAAHLEMLDGETGTEPDYLRKLVKRFGLPAGAPDEMRPISGNRGGQGPE
jgi:hypothetical protein